MSLKRLCIGVIKACIALTAMSTLPAAVYAPVPMPPEPSQNPVFAIFIATLPFILVGLGIYITLYVIANYMVED